MLNNNSNNICAPVLCMCLTDDQVDIVFVVLQYAPGEIQRIIPGNKFCNLGFFAFFGEVKYPIQTNGRSAKINYCMATYNRIYLSPVSAAVGSTQPNRNGVASRD